MNILSPRDRFITNEEVFEHLKSTNLTIKKFQKNKKFYHKFNNQIYDYELLSKRIQSYFEKTPTNSQSIAKISKLNQELLIKFDERLMEIERFQIINLIPKNIVNLYSIIEECDSRFNEVECQDMIDLLKDYFPKEFEELDEEVEMEVDKETTTNNTNGTTNVEEESSDEEENEEDEVIEDVENELIQNKSNVNEDFEGVNDDDEE